MAQTLTTDLEQIDGGEAADINSAQSAFRRYQLPEVVDSGETGNQIADLTLLIFTNTGQGVCELFEFGTGRVVERVGPYEKVTLRALLAAASTNGDNQWQVVNQRETIIAVSEAAHIADAAITAVTSPDSAAAISNSNTYADSNYNGGLNTALDAALAGFETDFDASVAECETKINAIIDALEAANISAAA